MMVVDGVKWDSARWYETTACLVKRYPSGPWEMARDVNNTLRMVSEIIGRFADSGCAFRP